MLKFEEAQRPSFTELSKLVLTSTENTIESPKGGAANKKSIQSGNKQSGLPLDQRKVNKVYSMRDFKDSVSGSNPIAASMSEKAGSSKLQRKGTDLSM